MGESFVNYGRDGRSSETHPRFSVPPPNIPMQPNLNKNIRQWDNAAGDAPPMWNTGGYSDNYGGGSDNHANMNFRRENNRGMGNGGGNKDGYNKGYGGGGASSSGNNEMIIQEDTIFVSGMDPSITEQDIHNHFGSIGIIKKDKKTMKPKIWLYKHKDSGLSKGEATVTYDDINAAKSAISWFDGRDFNGSTVKVSLAQRQNTWNKSGNKGNFGGPRGGGSAGGGNNAERGFFRDFERNSGLAREDRPTTARSNSGGPQGSNNRAVQGGNLSQREGDWKCAECNNTNFAWRNECNRCKAPKKETSSFDGSASKGGPGNKPPNFVDTRRNFRNNRGGGAGGGGGGGAMHLNYAQRDESDRNNSTPGSGFSGNRRDGGPVRNMTSDRGGRMRPY